MNVSSLTTRSIKTAKNPNGEAESFLQAVRRMASSLLKIFDRIGTSIALGESGDLEAAHAFRSKNSGT
jgi:hypothetical protein